MRCFLLPIPYSLFPALPVVALLHELGGDGVFVDAVVAGDYGEAVGGDEVVFLVFVGVVADDGAVGDVDVAVDDGVAEAGEAAVCCRGVSDGGSVPRAGG